MRFLRLLLPALAICFLAMGEKKNQLSVRFFAEANSRDGSAFSTPYKASNPPRDIYLQKIPTIHEGQIKEIFPFRASDGTWGCAFKLDNDGRINLEVVSTDSRGNALVGFIGTAHGNHAAVEMIIDKTVRDGIITIPRGLTDMEMALLGKQFKRFGGEEPPKLQQEKRGLFGKKKDPNPAALPQ
jgi:hypothetical protein